MCKTSVNRIICTTLILGYCLFANALTKPKQNNKVSRNTSFDVIVSKRDTLQSIFTRYGLDKNDLYTMLGQVNNKELVNIKPGQLIHFDTTNGRKLKSMKIFRAHNHTITVTNNNSKYSLKEVHSAKKGFYSKVEFVLKRSIYADGKKNGLSAANLGVIDQVMKADPTIDPKKFIMGTKVAVVLEGDGTTNGAKNVIAIHVLQGKKKWSVTRFNDKYGNHFYHPDGTSSEVSFLKYPMARFRVSSPFSLNRMHPIHHLRRAHYGVDFAAAKGSPIWSTAPGKVVFVGNKGGYGKTIILQHGGQYQTIYAHMSQYAKRLKVGDAIQQKQIIGYVGSTGHATGPHLHYELRLKGKPIDPLRAKLPKKAKLKGDMLDAFKQYQSHIIQALSVKGSKK
tara:strand:- start:311 stop:1492 length:1182 start_codon:yes stop_codon:yes gene_type:complete